jgi:flagellar biosynthesis/type III secretory pathway protein FliH
MTRFVLCRAGDLELACEGDPVLDAGALPVVGDAVAILRRVQTLREAALSSAVAARARALEQGLQEARTAVQAQACDAIARLAAQVEEALRAERERLRQREVDLALAIVGRIARDLGPAPLIAALARTAIDELDVAQPLRVRVPPGLADAIAEALHPGSMPDARLDATGRRSIEVVADERLEGFDCEIDQGDAIVDAGLATQLQSIRDALADSGTGAA